MKKGVPFRGLSGYLGGKTHRLKRRKLLGGKEGIKTPKGKKGRDLLCK